MMTAHDIAKKKWAEANLMFYGGTTAIPETTTTFNGNNAAWMLVPSGGTATTTQAGRSAIYGWHPQGIDVCGTQCVINIYPNNGVNYVYVDGVLKNTVSAGAWSSVTVNLGNDGWHYVEIRPSDFFVAIYRDYTNNSMSVTGSSPAVRYPQGFSTTLKNAREDQSGTFIVDDATAADSTFGRTTNTQYGWLRFKATTSGANIYAINQNSKWMSLFEDGVFKRTVQQTRPSYGWCDLGPTSASGEHEYWLIGDMQAICISAGTITTSALSARTLWHFFGDSITHGYSVSESRLCWPSVFGQLKGVAVLDGGINGDTLVNAAAGLAARATTYGATKVVLNYGHNDAGSQTLANWKLACYTALHGLCGVAGITNIYVVGMYNYTGDGATRTSFNSAMAAICAGGDDGGGHTLTSGEQAKITYIDSDGVVTPASDTFDGSHPNDTGGTVIGTWLASQI